MNTLYPLIFSTQVFDSDISNLLSMEDMWRYREKPVPLDFDAIREGKFVLRGEVGSTAKDLLKGANGARDECSNDKTSVNGAHKHTANGTAHPANGISTGTAFNGLKDQRALSLRDSLMLFVARYVPTILSQRLCNPNSWARK